MTEADDAHPYQPRVPGTTKRALITGISGQDGSYLAELLLDKGYEVHGIVRRSSSFNTDRIDHLYHDPHEQGVRLFTHYGDLTDSVALVKLLYELQPDEIYHLGAQSHVRVSFDIPEYTFDVTGAGTVRLLEAIREAGVNPRFYQASSSEMFGAAPAAAERGDAVPPPQPLRRGQGRLLLGHGQLPRGLRHVRRQRDPLQPRVPAPRRDLRHSQDHPRGRPDRGGPAGEALSSATSTPSATGDTRKEYVEAMWLMLQADEPDDFVIATGETHTVREAVEIAFAHAGLRRRRSRRDRPEVLPALRGRRAAR